MIKLKLGDCSSLLSELSSCSIDLTVTSPPYDNMREYNGYSFDFSKIAIELFRITKDGGVVVWVVGDETVRGDETCTAFQQALYFKKVGFKLADTMIYHKSDSAFPRYGHRKYPSAFEYMFVFSKGRVGTFNLIKDRKNKMSGAVMSGSVRQKDGTTIPSRSAGKTVAEFGSRTNVWSYSTGFGKSSSDLSAFQHPAIFPEALASDHISTWSNLNDTVLDPFMGSGTTGAMSKRLGRHFIGFEVSEDYFILAKNRIANTKRGS